MNRDACLVEDVAGQGIETAEGHIGSVIGQLGPDWCRGLGVLTRPWSETEKGVLVKAVLGKHSYDKIALSLNRTADECRLMASQLRCGIEAYPSFVVNRLPVSDPDEDGTSDAAPIAPPSAPTLASIHRMVAQLGAGYQDLLELTMFLVAVQTIALAIPVKAIVPLLPNMSRSDLGMVARNKMAIEAMLNTDKDQPPLVQTGPQGLSPEHLPAGHPDRTTER